MRIFLLIILLVLTGCSDSKTATDYAVDQCKNQQADLAVLTWKREHVETTTARGWPVKYDIYHLIKVECK